MHTCRFIAVLTFAAILSFSGQQTALAQGVGLGPPTLDVNVVDIADGDRFQVRLPFASGDGSTTLGLAIPPGKRLLVDFVSAEVRLPDTQRGRVGLAVGPSAPSIGGDPVVPVADRFPLVDTDSRISTGPDYRVWLLAQEVDLWADSFAAVRISRGPSLDGPFPDNGSIAGGVVWLAGRLVDIP